MGMGMGMGSSKIQVCLKAHCHAPLIQVWCKQIFFNNIYFLSKNVYSSVIDYKFIVIVR